MTVNSIRFEPIETFNANDEKTIRYSFTFPVGAIIPTIDDDWEDVTKYSCYYVKDVYGNIIIDKTPFGLNDYTSAIHQFTIPANSTLNYSTEQTFTLYIEICGEDTRNTFYSAMNFYCEDDTYVDLIEVNTTNELSVYGINNINGISIYGKIKYSQDVSNIDVSNIGEIRIKIFGDNGEIYYDNLMESRDSFYIEGLPLDLLLYIQPYGITTKGRSFKGNAYRFVAGVKNYEESELGTLNTSLSALPDNANGAIDISWYIGNTTGLEECMICRTSDSSMVRYTLNNSFIDENSGDFGNQVSDVLIDSGKEYTYELWVRINGTWYIKENVSASCKFEYDYLTYRVLQYISSDLKEGYSQLKIISSYPIEVTTKNPTVVVETMDSKYPIVTTVGNMRCAEGMVEINCIDFNQSCEISEEKSNELRDLARKYAEITNPLLLRLSTGRSYLIKPIESYDEANIYDNNARSIKFSWKEVGNAYDLLDLKKAFMFGSEGKEFEANENYRGIPGYYSGDDWKERLIYNDSIAVEWEG